MLALGAAKGNFIIFRIFLDILCFGNLIATVSKLDVANLDNLENFFFFKIKVIGPGQKALKSLKKFSFNSTSFFSLNIFFTALSE